MIILLSTALHAQDTTNTALKWAVAGQALDLISTEIGLANGGTELNPLMTDRTVRITFKTALSIMAYIYVKRYPENKQDMIIFAVLSWLPVGWNLIQITK